MVSQLHPNGFLSWTGSGSAAFPVPYARGPCLPRAQDTDAPAPGRRAHSSNHGIRLAPRAAPPLLDPPCQRTTGATYAAHLRPRSAFTRRVIPASLAWGPIYTLATTLSVTGTGLLPTIRDHPLDDFMAELDGELKAAERLHDPDPDAAIYKEARRQLGLPCRATPPGLRVPAGGQDSPPAIGRP